jgi:hypothetical protein
MKTIVTLGVLAVLTSSCGKSESSSKSKSNIKETSKNEVLKSPSDLQTESQFVNSYNSLFKTKKKPKTYSNRYIQKYEKYLDEKELNGQIFEKGLREVLITAKHLVLKKNSSQRFYEILNESVDIKTLTIEADIVEIHDPLWIKQANIIFKAKTIKFLDNASIKTTPVAINHLPEATVDGKDGFRGGDITLFSENIEAQNKDAVHLITDGGLGQDGGPGLNGARGTNAHLYHGYYRYEQYSCSNRDDRKKSRKENCSRTKNKKGRPSGNGANATAGGNPGSGGAPGKITFNMPFSLKTSLNPGKNGLVPADTVGGLAGTPVRTCAMKRYKGSSSSKKQYGCVNAVNGSNASVSPVYKETENKEVKIEGILFLPVRSVYKFEKLYIKDLYKSGYFNETLEEMEKQKLRYPTIKKIGLKSYENNLGRRLNYYGKAINWAPKLGLEINFELYKKEIKRNLELIVNANYLSRKIKSDSYKFEDILDFQESLKKSIMENQSRISRDVGNTVKVDTLVKEVEIAENEFQFELKLIEKEIKKKAKNNLKVPFMDKAVKLFSVASKVIPVGQPTLGAIGMGVDFLHNSMKGDQTATEILEKVPTIAQGFKDFNWSKASRQLDQKLAELNPANLLYLEDNKERLAYLEEAKNFAAPIYREISGQVKLWQKQEVSKSKLDKEINKIKQSHKMYKKVVSKLNKLLLKRQQLRKKMLELTAKIEKQIIEISEGYNSIAATAIELNKVSLENLDSLNGKILEAIDMAKDRIDFYEHNFEKSFEYSMLDSKVTESSIEENFRQIRELYELTNIDSDSMYTDFERRIADITETIVSNFEATGASKNLQKQISLSEKELSALNKGEEIYLDLTTKAFWGEHRENLRLKSAYLDDSVSISSDGEQDIEISIEHIGQSIIEKAGEEYLFSHALGSSNTAKKWETIISSATGEVFESTENRSDSSLLMSLVGSHRDVSVFSNLGARTYLKIVLRKKKSDKLNSANIILDYLYNIK